LRYVPGVLKPFRFGLSIGSASSRAEWREVARRAEANGFGTLLVADHLAPMFPPMTALATAAEATDRLHVGTYVVNNDFRHPVLLAREAATLGLLTEGRFELGLGAGHMKPEYDEVGLAFDPAAVRVARLAESVEIVRGLLDGEEVIWHGEHYGVDGHRGFPALEPAHRVPLLVGGNGRRVLSIAARRADMVGFIGFAHNADATGLTFPNFTAGGLAEQVDWVRDRAGERFDELELSALVQWVWITPDRRAAAERLHEQVPALSVDEILDSPFLLLGTHGQMAEQLRERRERFSVSYWVTFATRPNSDQGPDSLASVIELLS